MLVFVYSAAFLLRVEWRQGVHYYRLYNMDCIIPIDRNLQLPFTNGICQTRVDMVAASVGKHALSSVKMREAHPWRQ